MATEYYFVCGHATPMQSPGFEGYATCDCKDCIYGFDKARVNLASTEIDKLNQICDSIVDIAKKTKVEVRGPIPLPTKKLKLTTRRSPDGEGKASWENYEMRIHKRLIDLGVDERALRLVMRVPIPEKVNIEIELLD